MTHSAMLRSTPTARVPSRLNSSYAVSGIRSGADCRPPADASVATSIPRGMVPGHPRQPSSPHNVSPMNAIGVLHPGEMGAALGARLRECGREVRWAGEGRSDRTHARAAAAGLGAAGAVPAIAAGTDVLLSVCPPHAARDVAREVAGYTGVFVDANAISPLT